MLQTFRKLLDLMTPPERRRFYLLLGIIMVFGLAEMISVAAVLPFMAVLADPDIIETNHRLAAIYHWLGFAEPRGLPDLPRGRACSSSWSWGCCSRP